MKIVFSKEELLEIVGAVHLEMKGKEGS